MAIGITVDPIGPVSLKSSEIKVAIDIKNGTYVGTEFELKYKKKYFDAISECGATVRISIVEPDCRMDFDGMIDRIGTQDLILQLEAR